MEACELIKYLKDTSSSKDDVVVKRCYDGIYGKDEIDDQLYHLYNPPVLDAGSLKKLKLNPINLDRCKLSLDVDSINRICKDIKYPILPTDCKLNFLGEALDTLRMGLYSIQNYNLQHEDFDNAEDCFKKIMEAFFAVLNSESPYSIDIDASNSLDQSIALDEIPPASSDPPHSVNIDDPIQSVPVGNANIVTGHDMSDEIKIIEQLFLSLVLGYNWSLQLSQYTDTALNIVTSGMDTVKPDVILTVALGLKEANRNMIFYKSITSQLWKYLEDRNTFLDGFISRCMNKIIFLKQIILHESSYEPQSWNKLKALYEKEMTTHEDILECIRSEMKLRMSSKLECDYLRREYEKVSHDLSQLVLKKQELCDRIEVLKKQLNEMMDGYNVEVNMIGKITDSKKLPKPLYRLLSHLHLYALSNPLREMTFKVIKDDESYSLQMNLITPKDLLMPSYEFSLKVFPLIFKFILDDDTIIIKLVSRINLSNSISQEVINIFNGIESINGVIDNYESWGISGVIGENNHINLELFNQEMNTYYLRGQYIVWKLYILQIYKTKADTKAVEQLLPKELCNNVVKSHYTYKKGLTWSLENDGSSVELELVSKGSDLTFTFQDYTSKSKLEYEIATPLAKHFMTIYPKLKDVKSKLKALNGFSNEIYKYFGDDYKFIDLLILFESFRVF